MEALAKADVFFVISSIAVIAVAVVFIVFTIYLVKLVRDAKRMLHRMEKGFNNVGRIVGKRALLTSGIFRILTSSSFYRNILRSRAEKREPLEFEDY